MAHSDRQPHKVVVNRVLCEWRKVIRNENLRRELADPAAMHESINRLERELQEHDTRLEEEKKLGCVPLRLKRSGFLGGYSDVYVPNGPKSLS